MVSHHTLLKLEFFFQVFTSIFRLRMNEHHIVSGRWIEAMGLMALPPNVPKSLQHLSTLVDDIWYHAGDTSADVSSLLL